MAGPRQTLCWFFEHFTRTAGFGLTQWMLLAELNALPPEHAREQLLACCAAPDWAAQVARQRPYQDHEALRVAAQVALEALPWSQVEAALAAHPRIGAQLSGRSREATWSRREQAGAATADEATRADLVKVNQEYEQRFGHVFLVCAAGRSAAELLAQARGRLGNDVATEREVVRRELAAITQLRLERLVTR